MSDIETVIEHAAQRCRVKGKMLTEKRKLVLRALLHADRALSAYELVDYCKTHFSQSIQAMSVYRILEFLEQEHFAHKLNVSNKFVVCAHIMQDKAHVPQFMICAQCDKITEGTIDPALISEFQQQAKQEGFTVIRSQLEITCLCDKCDK